MALKSCMILSAYKQLRETDNQSSRHTGKHLLHKQDLARMENPVFLPPLVFV